ncbi:hypothetical protein YC2023_097082 [Brassica napus]
MVQITKPQPIAVAHRLNLDTPSSVNPWLMAIALLLLFRSLYLHIMVIIKAMETNRHAKVIDNEKLKFTLERECCILELCEKFVFVWSSFKLFLFCFFLSSSTIFWFGAVCETKCCLLLYLFFELFFFLWRNKKNIEVAKD